MRDRTFLVLMEQLIMIVVFAVSSAVCLNIFVYSWQISRKSEAKYEAAFIAQSIAEDIKATDGTMLFTWDERNGAFYKEYSEEGRRYTAEIMADEDAEGFNKAEIKVIFEQEEIFSIPVAWQEVAEDE